MNEYEKLAKKLKALADPKRLQIVDMLSCGEMCACDIQENFNVTQPTLSHDMKVLCNCGIVNVRRDGKWTYYSLNQDFLDGFPLEMKHLCREKENCPCNVKKLC